MNISFVGVYCISCSSLRTSIMLLKLGTIRPDGDIKKAVYTAYICVHIQIYGHTHACLCAWVCV